LAFDVGMLYAASMLRLLATRRAGLGEQWVHVLVMVSVAAIEAATYMDMAWRYESPSMALAWALIGVRAAPLLAVYLSMARPLPVTARDILAQAELASGAGVIRDVVREAQDASAPLAHKIALYGASAVMHGDDRERLHAMLAVVQAPAVAPLAIAAPESRPDASSGPPEPPPTPPDPPTPAPLRSKRQRNAPVLRLAELPERRVRALLEREPTITIRQLAKRAGISQSTASKWRKVVLGEAQREAVSEQ
jgi:hypothetical protein